MRVYGNIFWYIEFLSYVWKYANTSKGVGDFTNIETTPECTFITFKDRFTAEKFMYGTSNGEIPSVGKVELAWVQTPLPPVNLSTGSLGVSKMEKQDEMKL